MEALGLAPGFFLLTLPLLLRSNARRFFGLACSFGLAGFLFQPEPFRFTPGLLLALLLPFRGNAHRLLGLAGFLFQSETLCLRPALRFFVGGYVWG